MRYFICAVYDSQTGQTSTLWLVTTIKNDVYTTGDSIKVNGKEYILGKKDIDADTISSYELIPRNEVLEI